MSRLQKILAVFWILMSVILMMTGIFFFANNSGYGNLFYYAGKLLLVVPTVIFSVIFVFAEFINTIRDYSRRKRRMNGYTLKRDDDEDQEELPFY